jgi:hypothetical protein
VPDVTQLFDEYASAYARGERPHADDFLRRAGSAADELARMIDRFLAGAPRPPADESSVTVVEAWSAGEPPLVALRAHRGVRVDEVVDAIVDEAGVAPSKRAKVKRYYQELEGGLLDPAGVSARVWSVVKRLLGSDAERAAAWRGPATPITAAAAFFRADIAPLAHGVHEPVASASEEADEVDELFRAGS